MASTLLIGEVHTFWEKPEEYREINGQKVLFTYVDGRWVQAKKENWIVTKYEPMTVQWNIKMLGDEVIPVLYFIAAWFFWMYPNATNKTTVSIFIYAQFVDIYFYFWNFKTYDYHILYTFMIVGWYILYKKSIKKNKLSNEKGNIARSTAGRRR